LADLHQEKPKAPTAERIFQTVPGARQLPIIPLFTLRGFAGTRKGDKVFPPKSESCRPPSEKQSFQGKTTRRRCSKTCWSKSRLTDGSICFFCFCQLLPYVFCPVFFAVLTLLLGLHTPNTTKTNQKHLPKQKTTAQTRFFNIFILLINYHLPLSLLPLWSRWSWDLGDDLDAALALVSPPRPVTGFFRIQSETNWFGSPGCWGGGRFAGLSCLIGPRNPIFHFSPGPIPPHGFLWLFTTIPKKTPYPIAAKTAFPEPKPRRPHCFLRSLADLWPFRLFVPPPEWETGFWGARGLRRLFCVPFLLPHYLVVTFAECAAGEPWSAAVRFF